MDDAVCLALHSQKKGQHSTQSCLHVMVCTNASCCMVCGECGRVLWCGDVVDAGGKKGRGKHTVKQKQKGLFPKPLFPFSLFSPLFLPLFSPCLPLFHHHSFLIYTLTCFSCFTHECIRGEPKTPTTQHLILFIVFSFCPNSLFRFFSFSR